MHTLTRSTQVSVPAATAWGLVGEPGSIASWHPAIASSAMDGQNRECVLADGARIQEAIRERDDDKRRYTYVITGGPLPVKDYASTISVEALADNRCTITWAVSYEPLAPAEEVEALLAGVYEAGLSAARERLEG